jgi:hypothetical protein
VRERGDRALSELLRPFSTLIVPLFFVLMGERHQPRHALSMTTGRPMPSSAAPPHSSEEVGLAGREWVNGPISRRVTRRSRGVRSRIMQPKVVEMKAVHATRLKLEEFLSAIAATVRTALRPNGQEAAMNQQVSETEVG